MFAVPLMPDLPDLISRDEVKDMNGKLRALVKLLQNSEAQTPEMLPHVQLLTSTIAALLRVANCIRRNNTRAAIENAFRKINELEDLLIRVVIMGQDPEEVIANKKLNN